MYFRTGPPSNERASTSVSPMGRPLLYCRHPRSAIFSSGSGQPHYLTSGRSQRTYRAIAQEERRTARSKTDADAAQPSEVVQQLLDTLAAEEGYVPLSEAQDMIEDVLAANTPAPPKYLTFCKTGEQELRLVNYTVNGALVGLSLFIAASQLGNPSSAAAGPSLFSALKAAAQQGWQGYEYLVDAHPLLTKAAISGTVYGLGDLTAQTYEGRSWKEFDAPRIIRSSLCGFLAHGPLSHLFYEQLDRFLIVSKYFDGGDAWYTPLFKIAIDQTFFAAAWNSLYYLMLGAMKLDSPHTILKSVTTSWWELLKAGWRVWPIVHLLTYTVIPCQDRVLWVDMVELAWVTILSIYGQQRRDRAGAAACALPGVAGEGGIFTDDILRGMTVESQIVFQSADGEPVVRQLEEVLVEAALLEANVASSLDRANRYTQPSGSQDGDV